MADLAMGEVSQVARTAEIDDIDAWWDRVDSGLQRTVSRGFETTARLAGDYLSLSAALAGVEVEPLVAVLNLFQVAESLRITGPVAFKVNVRRTANPDVAKRVMADRLAASTNRLVLAGSRRTVIDTANTSSSVARYRRIAQPGACDFCEMLASRGAVYTKASGSGVVGRSGKPRGSRRIGESYHDDCRCYVELEWTTK